MRPFAFRNGELFTVSFDIATESSPKRCGASWRSSTRVPSITGWRIAAVIDYHDEDPGRPEVVIAFAVVAGFMFLAGVIAAQQPYLSIAIGAVFGAVCGWVTGNLPPWQSRALPIAIASTGLISLTLGHLLALTLGGSAGG